MKKNFLFAACAWLLSFGQVLADELIINDVSIPQGGSAQLTVGFRFTSTTDKVGFAFSLGLPEGITLEKDGDGEPIVMKDETSIPKLNIIYGGEGNFGGQPSTENATIKGTEGALITLTIKANSSLAVGSTHTVSVTQASFQERVDGNVRDINLSDFTFTITIVEPTDTRIVFDETSTSLPTLPTPATNVDVRVKRTIKANEWSTICLPFAMSEGQVQTAFGEDVQLAELKSWEEVDDDAIAVTFSDVAAIEANTPYVLKVSKQITEFTVDGVDVDPEDDPAVTMGKMSRGTFASFTGSYVPVYIDEECLFLSDNKFWYSTGKTRMKGYRAYFYFQTVVSDYSGSEAKVRFFIDDTATNIEGISSSMSSDAVYSVNGVRMGSADKLKALPKGLYIVNGKKVIIK